MKDVAKDKNRQTSLDDEEVQSLKYAFEVVNKRVHEISSFSSSLFLSFHFQTKKMGRVAGEATSRLLRNIRRRYRPNSWSNDLGN